MATTYSLRNLKKQLITHEDPGHVHKILGVACLASTLWRFSLYLGKKEDTDMGFAAYPHWTVPTLLLHFSLTASSFLFKIPAKRIKTGDRICKLLLLFHHCLSGAQCRCHLRLELL